MKQNLEIENLDLDFDIAQPEGSRSKPIGCPWPEARIVRPAGMLPGDNDDLQTLLNVLGRRNYGKGKGFSLGSVMSTIVSATEMGRMLQARYPKVYDNRRKTIQLQHRIARSYADFVNSSRQNVSDDAFSAFKMELELEADGGVDEDEAEIPFVNEAGWSEASFCVAGYAKYGSNHLGLDLSFNEALLEEVEATLGFLRGSEKLDVSVVDPGRKPHVVVFETFGKLGATTLQAVAPPAFVSLDAPRMLVNSNEPRY